MYVDTLVIEVTRRCNLQCAHCLRGEPQNKSIPIKYVREFFNKVDYINILTISGGEPTLVPRRIIDIVYEARESGVDIQNYYIATNAVRIGELFLEAVKELHRFCSDNEVSQINYSNDQFHESVNYDDIAKLEQMFIEEFGLEDRVGPKYNNRFPPDWSTVIGEGRARGASREVSRSPFEIDDETVTEGTLYLNVNGWVLGACDLSYESQREKRWQVCRVEKFSVDALRKWNNMIKREREDGE
jgi:hypothetical protein